MLGEREVYFKKPYERQSEDNRNSFVAEQSHLWIGSEELIRNSKVKSMGVFNYLATLQGIKSTSLDIDTDVNMEVICSQNWYNVVVFTADTTKWAGS